MTTKTGSRAPVAPEQSRDEQRHDVLISRHPSFATVGFFSMQGSSGLDLFGANVRVANTIRMRVSRAHMESGTVDRVCEDDTILELELSESQFTQAITQFNRGTGTAATLRQAPDLDVRPVVYPQIASATVEERLKTNADRRLERELAKIVEAVSAVTEIANADGSVSKKALQSAVRTLGYAVGNLPGNFDYYKKVMREDVDAFLDEAKMELHASANLLLAEGRAPSVVIEDLSKED